MAVRRVVGGALPQWNGEVPPALEKEIVGHVEELQVLFTQRLEEWARYMAAYGATRQGKWNHKGWIRLVFEAMRANANGARERRCEGTRARGEGTSVPHCWESEHRQGAPEERALMLQHVRGETQEAGETRWKSGSGRSGM